MTGAVMSERILSITRVHLPEVDSTNRYAVLHQHELPDGALIVADLQTAGRGRRGREWISPAGCNIYATLLIKDPEPRLFLAGALLGLAAEAALREILPDAPFFLKWPNDIYCRERKIAGILCEGCGFSQGKLTGIAAGIGINVNLSEEKLAEIDLPATSLRALAGHEFTLENVLKILEKNLLKYYIIYSKYPDELFARWKAANRLLGQNLELIRETGEVVQGRFADIADDGNLILERAGEMLSFCSGDVRVRRGSIDWKQLECNQINKEVNNG